jgi:thiol-disulfide isomerase/thioredoxin
MALIAGAGLVVIFAVALFVGVSFSSSSTTHAPGLRVGSPAPAWSGTSLTGRRLSSRTERGHWVVLNFFATWCEPCQEETPALERFVAAHRPAEVSVVSVLDFDSTAAARRFVAKRGVDWPILTTSPGAAYDVTRAGLPETFVIDPQGRLVDSRLGAVTVAVLDRDLAHDP